MGKSEQPGPRSGEYIIDGSTIRTARRLAEYLRDWESRHPARAKRHPERVFHMIRPQYCKMLGINPDEMIAISLHDIWVRKLEADIAANYSQLPETMPLADRILEAHLRAYDGANDEIMAFVKEKFFGKRG